MPPADARLSLDPIPPDPARVVRHQEEWIASLPARIDFGSMRPLQARSLLGGIFRGGEGLPWGSVRSGFLIRVPEKAESLTLEIDVPDRVELRGGRIHADVNGEVVELRDGANRVSVTPGVVQVVVTSDRYFATMEDARQRSFRWVRAEAN
jgi:hypothetical protein